MTNEPRPKSDDFEPLKSKDRVWSEEINLAADQLVDKLKELVHEGNIRSVKIKREGQTLVEIPLTAAAAGGALSMFVAPQLVILGAIAGAITHCTVEIVHMGEPPSDRLSK